MAPESTKRWIFCSPVLFNRSLYTTVNQWTSLRSWSTGTTFWRSLTANDTNSAVSDRHATSVDFGQSKVPPRGWASGRSRKVISKIIKRRDRNGCDCKSRRCRLAAPLAGAVPASLSISLSVSGMSSMQRAPAKPPPHRPPSPSPGIQWFLLLNPRARTAGATLLATRSMSQCYPILKLALSRRVVKELWCELLFPGYLGYLIYFIFAQPVKNSQCLNYSKLAGGRGNICTFDKCRRTAWYERK